MAIFETHYLSTLKSHYLRGALSDLFPRYLRADSSFALILFVSLIHAVLEARADFAAIYFIRVTSFSALSLPLGTP